MSGAELTGSVGDRLLRGEICLLGRMPWGSNATFLVEVAEAGAASSVDSAGETARKDRGESSQEPLLAVYKPASGERPLWDFEEGTLCKREVAAYRFSELVGWGLVPPTFLREGPLGVGSVQLHLNIDPAEHYFTLGPEREDDLRRLVAFDVVVNNADRKAGHVVLGVDGRLWSIDHGTTFHLEQKLRSVIWEFAGQPLDRAILDDLAPFACDGERYRDLVRVLGPVLSIREVEATGVRIRDLVDSGRFPSPSGERSFPWPMI